MAQTVATVVFALIVMRNKPHSSCFHLDYEIMPPWRHAVGICCTGDRLLVYAGLDRQTRRPCAWAYWLLCRDESRPPLPRCVAMLIRWQH